MSIRISRICVGNPRPSRPAAYRNVYGVGYRFIERGEKNKRSKLAAPLPIISSRLAASPSIHLWRFAMIFGGIVCFFLAAIGIILYLVFSQANPFFPPPCCPFFAVCPSLYFASLAVWRVGLPLPGHTFRRHHGRRRRRGRGRPERARARRRAGRVWPPIRSFNHMVQELERSDQQRRNLTADVAHELRTPLHIIQGNLEGVLDGVYEPTPSTLPHWTKRASWRAWSRTCARSRWPKRANCRFILALRACRSADRCRRRIRSPAAAGNVELRWTSPPVDGDQRRL